MIGEPASKPPDIIGCWTIGLETTPGMGAGLEKLGIRGVCGVRPACPFVMSYPALMEKPVVGGPMGGGDITGPEGGGPIELAIGGAEGDEKEGAPPIDVV